jgi:hypothetical protein
MAHLRPIVAVSALAGVAGLWSPVVLAQWTPRLPTTTPRMADGRPNLAAPTPRMPDGKVDLSGIWLHDSMPYFRDLARDIPGGAPMQPWAAKLYEERKADLHAKDEPDANCLPQGVPKINGAPAPWKIIPLPGSVVILYEAFGQWRQIQMDGRTTVPDPNPSWLGYSTGRWDGDALVVTTNGLNGKTWLDTSGHPTTEALTVTERFRRPSFGRMEIDITIDDPKTYTKPWGATIRARLLPDTELLEFVCLENERFQKH